MSYGPDWPPTPEPVEALPEAMTLGQKCIATVIAYGLIWAFWALVLMAFNPMPSLDVPTPPAHGHTTDVTTTPQPSPHVAR